YEKNITYIQKWFSVIDHRSCTLNSNLRSSKVQKEDKTLTCSYTSNTYYCIAWYKNSPYSAMQFVIWSCGSPRENGRFIATGYSTSARLTISRLELSDAAVYYCAVEHCDNIHCTALQNLHYFC
uniref:Ig-like domain-containing protein n=1 Tax=Leptobrachium leishanense TaxID=445787 RepID=A0A8C5QSM5_9ANUR